MADAADAVVAIRDAAQLLRVPANDGYLRHDRAAELGLEGGSLTAYDGVITALADTPDADTVIDARGCAVIPGFVDCHTHLPFAGWRAHEYEQKVTGVPYEQIARAGGGIRASARAFAEASDEQVLAQACALASEMLAHGTTAFECKSGYGLSADAELRALRLAAALDEQLPQATSSTALLAHAVPDGYDADSWMGIIADLTELVRERTAARALDIYVESVAFENRHLERLGGIARTAGLDLRAHVEQFAANRSVPVALAAGARSVDHLSWLHEDDVDPLARAECAAVLLPGAEFLGAERLPPARALADAGVICALASDLNPGTSPVASLPVVIGLAVRRYGWSVREALLATTLNAAWVLRMSERRGSLAVGKAADVLVLDGPVEHIPYRFARNPVACVLVAGRLAWVREDQRWRVEARP
jgi:imidazolonepropionase